MALGTTVVRNGLSFGLLLALAGASSAGAQDQGLDPLLFAPAGAKSGQVDARAVQLYRIPLGLQLRAMDEDRWGVRLTFPVSLSTIRVERTSDLKPFAKSVGIAAVVPGIELRSE